MGDDFTLGRHEQAINQLLANDAAIMQTLKAIETTLAEQRGAARTRTLMWGAVGGASSVLGGFLLKVLSTYVTVKHP